MLNYNYGVVSDYIGFNTSYVFSQKIRRYARTKVDGLNILDPIPLLVIIIRLIVLYDYYGTKIWDKSHTRNKTY